MSEKYFHIGFMVKLTNLHDVLSALVVYKAGSVEVRPVTNGFEPDHPPTTGNAVRTPVREYMKMGEKVTAKTLAKELNVNIKSVYTALAYLKRKGFVKKTGVGQYMRVKEDPQ